MAKGRLTRSSSKHAVQVRSVEMIFLFVSNLRKSRRFYKDLLGLEEIYSDNSRIVYDLKDAWLMICPEYGHWKKPKAHGWGFALYLDVKSVDTAIGFLRKKRVPIYKEAEDQRWGLRDAGIIDPDGYHIYLCQVLKGSWELNLPSHARKYPKLPPPK